MALYNAQQTTLHGEVEEHDRERELDCTSHNEKTDSMGSKQKFTKSLILITEESH